MEFVFDRNFSKLSFTQEVTREVATSSRNALLFPVFVLSKHGAWMSCASCNGRVMLVRLKRDRPHSPRFLEIKNFLAIGDGGQTMLFKRPFIAAGLTDASSHSGLRTFATTLIERVVDIKAVSTLMGHARVGIAERYFEDNQTRLRQISEDVRLRICSNWQ